MSVIILFSQCNSYSNIEMTYRQRMTPYNSRKSKRGEKRREYSTCRSPSTPEKKSKKRKLVVKSPTKAEILRELKSMNLKLEVLNMKMNTLLDSGRSSKRATTQDGSYCVVM